VDAGAGNGRLDAGGGQDAADTTSEASCYEACVRDFPHDYGIYLDVYTCCDACDAECTAADFCKRGEGDAIHAMTPTAACFACLKPTFAAGGSCDPEKMSSSVQAAPFVRCVRSCL
jgi:hypothetical protein